MLGEAKKRIETAAIVNKACGHSVMWCGDHYSLAEKLDSHVEVTDLREYDSQRVKRREKKPRRR